MAGHNTAAPGFSQSHDPFAALVDKEGHSVDELDFDDTYDGLGEQLEETNDAFNNDTFGGGSGAVGSDSKAPVGKDFDFFGQTARVTDAIDEEHARFDRQKFAPTASATVASSHVQPITTFSYPTSRPVRTGYERYQELEPAADLQVDASIWGTAPKKTTPAPPSQNHHAPPPAPAPAPARKVMSLEEVEAGMRAQAKTLNQAQGQPQGQTRFTPPQAHMQPVPQQQIRPLQYGPANHVDYHYPPNSHSQPLQPVDGRHAIPGAFDPHVQQSGVHLPFQAPPGPPANAMTILQRPLSKHASAGGYHTTSPLPNHHQPQYQLPPTQILQNPNRYPGDVTRMAGPPHAVHPMQQAHRTQHSFPRYPQPGHPNLANMSEQERAAFQEAEARRAKRNHKIYMLSRDNGVMTSNDKSFITRIQLQQLVSAIGDPHESVNGAPAGDFYYHVYSSLQAAQRPTPNQPLNNFAQAYLFQTGNRFGGMRRGRHPENHMQRMAQQVQRAVEAAKNKPKSKQLVIEGSLGKISFSNAKTPKPSLNIKRAESGNDVKPGNTQRPQDVTDRKVTLRAIEQVYNVLMEMEDQERMMPVPPSGSADQALADRHAEWKLVYDTMNTKLWDALKVHDPVGASVVHPFIALLSFPKGKKAMNRVFRLLNHEQRTTVLTLIIYHLDELDVVQNAQVKSGETIHLTAAMRESIELFSVAVMPCLFTFLRDASLDIVTAVLGIIISKHNMDVIARTRVGISILTMILSRAEIIKQSGQADEASWKDWVARFNDFFNLMEPILPSIFPATIISGEDIYVWQFLAAIGIGATPEEQQRLVLAVKDRVMDTVAMSKTLPADMSKSRLDNVNLFMHAIGLDVELLLLE